MLKYDFPVIEHIDDVLPAIADSSEFVVARKEDFTFIQYAVSAPETFGVVGDANAHLRRECRGLTFDRNGKILSRRFHKFFNIGEREETLPSKIDMTQKHTLMEKLDGSMMTPLIIDGNVTWATKQGYSEVAQTATKWLNSHTNNYEKLARYMHESSRTPIFEFCAPFNRIVVEYQDPQMVLLAVRHNITGEYLSYDNLVAIAEEFDVPVVKQFTGFDSVEYLLEQAKQTQGSEGFVLDFDGHKVKTKSDWYLSIHRTIDMFYHPRHLANAILAETMDDAKSLMDDYRLQMANDFEAAFVRDIEQIVDRIANEIEVRQGTERKDFAASQSYKDLGIFGRTVFQNWDREPDLNVIFDQVKDILRKKVATSNTNFDTFAVDWLPNTRKVKISLF